MCGISGSADKERAFKFYQSNLPRGYYSSGYYDIQKTISSARNHLVKKEGCFEEAQCPYVEKLTSYFLYHSRGPTVETKEFIPDNNHPFMYGDWVVAHNGVISNFKELGIQYFPLQDFTDKTDSSIIPQLLSILPMSQALETLKGTFAVWMYNTKEHQLYLARSGSTLFFNPEGDFSSTEFKGALSVEEGRIYTVETKTATPFKIIMGNHFSHNSPYFFI